MDEDQLMEFHFAVALNHNHDVLLYACQSQ